MPRTTWCLLAPLLLAATTASAAKMCEAASGAHTVPLVELYTAEGCSDCPPADAWFSELSRDADPARAALLAFHVDYWDDIGWPDRFADAAYGRRHAVRVAMANSKVTYTPQVMIGEDTMVTWRDRSEVKSILARVRSRTAPVELTMQVVRQDSALRVGIKAAQLPAGSGKLEQGRVWLALYQDGLTSNIRAGENKGLTLHHDRVVRVLKGPWKVDDKPLLGEVGIALPAQADMASLGLVLFAESGKDGTGLQSLVLPFSVCAP